MRTGGKGGAMMGRPHCVAESAASKTRMEKGRGLDEEPLDEVSIRGMGRLDGDQRN
jgi:hypothetical protein